MPQSYNTSTTSCTTPHWAELYAAEVSALLSAVVSAKGLCLKHLTIAREPLGSVILGRALPSPHDALRLTTRHYISAPTDARKCCSALTGCSKVVSGVSRGCISGRTTDLVFLRHHPMEEKRGRQPQLNVRRFLLPVESTVQRYWIYSKNALCSLEQNSRHRQY